MAAQHGESQHGESQHGELRALSAAVLAVAQHLDVREVLQTIVTSARRLIGARYAALGVPDDNGSFAEFVVDGVSDDQWAAIGPLPRQHGLLGAMLREARPQRLADIRADPRFWGWPGAHPELVDFLGMPILDGQSVLGAVYLANKAGGFTDEDEALLGLLAAHAAIALTNARLYERSRELTLLAERTRIARELHDAVSQKLFSVRLTADAAAARLGSDPARAAGELRRVTELAGEALAELRSVIVELRPPGLADDGLVATLRKHVEVLDRVSDAAVTLTADGVCGLAAETEEAVLRVAQEALHNALRHGDPRTVAVRLAGDGSGGLVLEVGDDGTGFDPATPDGAGHRLGLASMRERSRSVGGRLTVSSAPDGGTTVRLAVPGG